MPSPAPSSAHANAADSPRLLGQFLRARRDSLRPEQVGLNAGLRRRAPGLRREEVATLCGISPTWYSWIEQGRAGAISVDTLAALANGLQLAPAERAYLFKLAARADPQPQEQAAGDPPALDALVAAVRAPAYVLDGAWTAVAWNRAAATLFADWLGPQPRGQTPQRNLLHYVFLHPQAQHFIVDWPQRARRLVAEFRADTAARPEDPACQSLVNGLMQASPDFAQAWRAQSVLGREGGERAFVLPARGSLRYRQYTLQLATHPEFKLTVLTPLDGASAA